MKIGKLPPEILGKIVLEYRGKMRSEVLVHSKLGEDCSVIDLGEYACVITTDPITGASANVGWLAVNVTCNDLAACGAEPIGVLLTILCPERSSEDDVTLAMEGAHNAAADIGAEIVGGHTEVTPGIREMIISCTALGKVHKDKYVTSSGAMPGDDIVITKAVGLEGTAILCTDFAELIEPHLGSDAVLRSQDFIKEISVVKEGLIAARFGVSSMHDITEGGVLGALYEVAEASNVGFVVEANQVPIREETSLLCKYLQIDPLRFVSSGSMLITTRDGKALVREFAKEAITAAVIGKISEGPRLIIHNGHKIAVGQPSSDELWTARAKLLSNGTRYAKG